MTYVSRVVQDWLQVALEQEDQGIHHAWLYFWPSFVKEMHTCFGIPDIVVEAAHSLDHLHMNPDDWIATYNIAFLQYSTQLQWTKNALCHRYYSRLPDRIQDIISTREGGKPSTFQTLYSIAVSIDNHFWEQKRESERASHSAPQQIPSSELSDSDSVLSFSTSGSVPRVLESPVKLESLVDLLSGLGSSVSSESLF